MIASNVAAESTVAMSVYNMIAVVKQPMTIASIVARLKLSHEPFAELEVEDIVKPVRRMARKGWIRSVQVTAPAGNFTYLNIVDPEYRIVKSRSRSVDGWNGWMVSCPNCAPRFLEDIVKELAA